MWQYDTFTRTHLVQHDHFKRKSRERRTYLRLKRLLHAPIFYLIYGSRRDDASVTEETVAAINHRTLEVSVDVALSARSSARTQPWGCL